MFPSHDLSALSAGSAAAVRSSLEVINEMPIVGNVSNPSTRELKQRIYDTFPTQNRAVTQRDYENLVYRMPSKFGSVKRCSVQKDADSQKRNLNIYVVSGFFNSETIDVGAFQRFRTVSLSSPNVSEIISVFDSQGNEYFEVEYLSQDIVFKELTNKNYKNDNVPSVIKPMIVNRKFTTVYSSAGVTLQFGSGDELAAEAVENPQEVAMNIFGKSYVTDTTFDPSRLTNNKFYGIVPQDTTLTVVFRQTNPINSNASANSINTVSNGLFEFNDLSALSAGSAAAARS